MLVMLTFKFDTLSLLKQAIIVHIFDEINEHPIPIPSLIIMQ